MFGNTFNDPRNQEMLSAGLQDMLLGLNNRQMTKVDALKKEERTRDFRALQLEEMRGKIAKDKREESQYNEGRKMFTELVAQNNGVVDAGVVQQLALQFPTLAKQVSSIVPKPPTPPAIQGLQAYRDTLTPGTPAYQEVEQAIDKAIAPAVPLVDLGRGELKQFQSTAAGRDVRMQQVAGELDTMAGKGIEGLNDWDYVVNELSPAGFRRFLMSDEGNTYASAMDNWVNVLGRTESGAQINKDEWSKWRTIYFPHADDPKELKLMKSQARKAVEQAFTIGMPGAAAYAREQAARIESYKPGDTAAPQAPQTPQPPPGLILPPGVKYIGPVQ